MPKHAIISSLPKKTPTEAQAPKMQTSVQGGITGRCRIRNVREERDARDGGTEPKPRRVREELLV